MLRVALVPGVVGDAGRTVSNPPGRKSVMSLTNSRKGLIGETSVTPPENLRVK